MPTIRAFVLLIILGLVSACASTPSKLESPPSKASELISQNLTNVLFQINSLDPQQVNLLLTFTGDNRNPFAKALTRSLQQSGYAIRTSGGDANTVDVSYSVKRVIDSSHGELNTYTLNIGPISVRRTYQPTGDGWVIPTSNMQVRGADISQIVSNDDIFLRTNELVAPAEIKLEVPTEIEPVVKVPVLHPVPRLPRVQAEPLLSQQQPQL